MAAAILPASKADGSSELVWIENRYFIRSQNDKPMESYGSFIFIPVWLIAPRKRSHKNTNRFPGKLTPKRKMLDDLTGAHMTGIEMP